MTNVVSDFLDILEDNNTLYHAKSNHEYTIEVSGENGFEKYHIILQETNERQVKVQGFALTMNEFGRWLRRKARIRQLEQLPKVT